MSSSSTRDTPAPREDDGEFEEEKDRELFVGIPEYKWTDNAISTSKYTLLTFLPKSLGEQFRRKGNVVFLSMGMLMLAGTYTNFFDTAATPWTLLIPLFVVISISVLQEGVADYQRHQSDKVTNNYICTVLRTNPNYPYGDHEIIGPNIFETDMFIFEEVARQKIYPGDLVLVKNREMVPADIVILASSSENGSAYIETSSIDGETNLKLRVSPSASVYKIPRPYEPYILLSEALHYNMVFHTPSIDDNNNTVSPERERFLRRSSSMPSMPSTRMLRNQFDEGEKKFMTLTSEAPNDSVSTFTGKLDFPMKENEEGKNITLALDADNLLLRGAVLRNTDWVIGVACFTGKDSKVAKNSFETPSKFSQLDVQMNKMIDIILYYLFFCAAILATLAVIAHSLYFDELYYAGYKQNNSTPWPYLPSSLPAPEWLDDYPNFFQFFLTFITLLPNLIPLALYVTVEVVTRFMMYLISVDKEMYHEETDTNAKARNMNVTDLGQVKYVFSDKTGTLTQNMMHFKRCTVDGKVFGPPMNLSNGSSLNNNDNQSKKHSSTAEEELNINAPYLPLSSLICNGDSQRQQQQEGQNLSFNTEMFLRIMSICHTVVVEKDHEVEQQEIENEGFNSFEALKRLKCTKRMKSNANLDSTVDEEQNTVAEMSNWSNSSSPSINGRKSVDGSPYRHAYQAESPDEGALVSAASLEFGFQLVDRDSNGIKIACSSPSVFEDEETVTGLRSGLLTSKMLSQGINIENLGQVDSLGTDMQTIGLENTNENNIRIEAWTLLAVNKFDSARKRMSVLVRSPKEFGSIPILFCKGADSSMFVPSVCEGANTLAFSDPRRSFRNLEVPASIVTNMELDSSNVDWEVAAMMQMQSHLGEFASEGLRTLVLGMRVLSEEECNDWLDIYRYAAESIERRDERLTEAALAIEQNLHIVGATAIEDKLQNGVPETIHRIEQAGIKLWVLTGDKMETAIEIGYSTKVLNQKMYLTQIANESIDKVKFLMAMEFVYLLQSGRLPEYEDIDEEEDIEVGKLDSLKNCWEKTTVKIERLFNSIEVGFWRFYYKYIRTVCGLISIDETELNAQLDRLQGGQDKLERKQNRLIRHKNVREYAMSILKEYRQTDDGKAALRKYRAMIHPTLDGAESELESVSSNSIPLFYDHGQSANRILQNYGRANRERVTVLEKLFAVDSDARKGRLLKHQRKTSVDDTTETQPVSHFTTRGLVVEGGALTHILGEDMLEEIFFAISSTCDAVIACRVSPKQKALLVRLVRNYVEPSPVTLAIGDGANDVGMIQEAHIGVGISGLEGQQAVNSSDFSISQFRFLDSLLLVHGKWNISRMSIVVLFSFYKNAIFSTLLMLYGYDNMYSGTPLVDPWVGSMFNFVAGFPILFLGCFDRDLEKEYIRRKPEVYAPGPNNELITKRISLRWASIMVIHSFMIYFISRPCLISAGGMTSAFKGLMSHNDKDRPGDGQGSGLEVFGTTIFTVLIYLLAYKVLFEGRSLIHGVFPPCTCKKDSGEGVWNRVPYTWVGIVFGSLLFNFFALYMYALVAQESPPHSPFIPFAHVTWHVFNKRSVTWMVMLIVPIISCAVDVALKLFANMFIPSQLQIHREIAVFEETKKNPTSRNVVVPQENGEAQLSAPLLEKSEIA